MCWNCHKCIVNIYDERFNIAGWNCYCRLVEGVEKSKRNKRIWESVKSVRCEFKQGKKKIEHRKMLVVHLVCLVIALTSSYMRMQTIDHGTFGISMCVHVYISLFRRIAIIVCVCVCALCSNNESNPAKQCVRLKVTRDTDQEGEQTNVKQTRKCI